MNTIHKTTRQWLAGMVTALAIAPACAATPTLAPASPEALYRKERAACLDGTSMQQRAPCLKEAGAALAEARRSRLGNGEDERALRANALLRCKAVREEDRDACRHISRGEGSVSGTVEGGGVLKELVTVEPAAPAVAR